MIRLPIVRIPVDTFDELVTAARAGGDWAFGRIWEELSPVVAGYLRGRGIPEVDDVTSEVFLAAFRGLATFEGDGPQFRSWIFTIAHHRGVDALRAGTAAGTHVEYSAQTDARVSDSAEDAALSTVRLTELGVFLDQLTPDQREVVLLRFVADLSLEQVSEVTGRPVGAVKQLQRRGLLALRRHLDGATSSEPVSHHPALSITEL